MFPQEFRPVYAYVMKDRVPQHGKILDAELWKSRGVVYARQYRDKIVYIGCTDDLLSTRTSAHLRLIPTSMRATAPRYREWAEGKHIVIVAYQPPPVKLLGRQVRVHRAIEAALIEEFGRPGAIDWFVDRK